MQTCTKCSAQSPDEEAYCVNCHADLSEYSMTSVALKKYQQNPRVRYVRIAVDANCCPACREVYGSYPKDNVPRLPVIECSHPAGCRCFYQPFFDEIFP